MISSLTKLEILDRFDREGNEQIEEDEFQDSEEDDEFDDDEEGDEDDDEEDFDEDDQSESPPPAKKKK